MKTVFKFAASVLLLVIATGAAVAAIPCQTKQKNSMHCGSDCPMMTMMHHAMAESSAVMNGTSCCQISGQQTTPDPVQILPERLAPAAVIADERGAAIVPFAHKMQARIRTTDLRTKPSAPAVLCTFLI